MGTWPSDDWIRQDRIDAETLLVMAFMRETLRRYTAGATEAERISVKLHYYTYRNYLATGEEPPI